MNPLVKKKKNYPLMGKPHRLGQEKRPNILYVANHLDQATLKHNCE